MQGDAVAPVTGPTSTVNVDNPGFPLVLLTPGGFASSSTADEIAEVVIAKGVPSCADVASLAAYFKTKFALP